MPFRHRKRQRAPGHHARAPAPIKGPFFRPSFLEDPWAALEAGGAAEGAGARPAEAQRDGDRNENENENKNKNKGGGGSEDGDERSLGGGARSSPAPRRDS